MSEQYNNTSEPETNSHVTRNIPKIKIPFPPVINPQDLISLRESPDGTQKLPSRAPNAFIIFRKQFVKAARDEGYFLPMTVISSMASEAWEAEREEVKSEYRRIAREAHIKRKAMYPKSSNRRRRKDRWNIVSFKPTNSSDSVSAITSRIPNDQPRSRYDGSRETPLSSPSLNLENASSLSSPEFSSNIGGSSPSINTTSPDLDYLNPAYTTLSTDPRSYSYYFDNSILEDPTFELYPGRSIYTSDDDSIHSTSPYLNAEQFYNDYMNSSSISTNDENQLIMTPDLIKEFNSVIERNIQQNDCYGDWPRIHHLQSVDVKTVDSITEKSENEDIYEQINMYMEGDCGDNMTATECWFDFSTSLANGYFGEALGILV